MNVDAYQQLSVATGNKLDHLWSLGNEIGSVDCLKSLAVHDFVKRVEGNLKSGDVSIKAEVQNIQLASKTKPSMPLTSIVAHIRSVAIDAKGTLDKMKGHVQCKLQYNELRCEIISFDVCLQDCDLTARQFLHVGRAMPYLTELGERIDLFEENLTVHTAKEEQLQKQVPPLQEGNQTGQCKDLENFTYVCQLLTEELLGYEDSLVCCPKIEPVVHHEVPEINNMTPLSRNQQHLSNDQGQTGEQNVLWHYEAMVPATDSSENSDAVEQLHGDSLMSDSTATDWPELGFLTPSIYECTVDPESLSQSYAESEDEGAWGGWVVPYPPYHIDHTVAFTNNGTGMKLPETEEKTTPGGAGNRTSFLQGESADTAEL